MPVLNHLVLFSVPQCVLRHHAVADCAVVGQEDALKGHVPFALCVLRDDVKKEEEKILEDIVEQVRNNIGPVAAFQKGVFVKQLPKTRSGKIPRSALSALVSGKPYKTILELVHDFRYNIVSTLFDSEDFNIP
ncbi:UNVERIFIED_CONTAM: hypothetical protein H355_008100 [Colinus virginianus]|nr:hypothetical protein H355_008100 [Colinus virginianus]